MLLHRLSVSFLLVSLATYGFTQGAATSIPTRTPTIDQSLDMASFSAPKISPDGKRVVYEVTTTNWETNAFDTTLWLADADGGHARRLSLAVKSSTDAAWSPDGRMIAFLSDRPGPLPKSPADKKQLYVMPADGGEAQDRDTTPDKPIDKPVSRPAKPRVQGGGSGQGDLF